MKRYVPWLVAFVVGTATALIGHHMNFVAVKWMGVAEMGLAMLLTIGEAA